MGLGGIHSHTQLRCRADRNGGVFTVTGHNVRVFLNDRESVGGYLRPACETTSVLLMISSGMNDG